MTTQGIIVLIAVGLTLLVWILDLVRRDRLYAGYGIIFLFTILGALLVLVVPALLGGITRLVGALFPASALTLLALCFIVFMLVYVLAQITVVSNRLAIVVQELAIRHTEASLAPHQPKTNRRD
jgi:hypothetical protein